jgi:hypothetical protein
MFLAFGVRHHPRGSRRPTVYQLAHRRLHGQLPGRCMINTGAAVSWES